MKERLTKNLGLKILAVVLAVFTWLIMVNVSNPVIKDTREVPIEVLNESILTTSNLTYELVGKKTVTVSYEVRVRDQYKITSNDFYATADLAEMYDVTGAIPVSVEVANREVKSLVQGTPTAKPGVVRIETEPLQNKKFVLESKVVGTPEKGFVEGHVTVNPEYVYATGAESDIGKINSLGIEVNLEGANSDRSGTAQVRFYDSNGNELKLAEEVDLSLESVNYHATILQVKEVPLTFEVQGETAEGYRYVGAEADVKSISVKGLPSVMYSVDSVTVPKAFLNVEGAKQNLTVEVDLSEALPVGVTMADGASVSANVTLKIERLVEREINYSLEDLILEGEKENYSYEIGSENVALVVRGLSKELDELSQSELVLHADVSDMEPGVQPVIIEAELDERFELMGQGPLMIHVKDLSEEAEESETRSNVTKETKADS